MKAWFSILMLFCLSTSHGLAQDRKQQFEQVDKLVADSNYGKAITIFNRLLETDSTDFEVYQRRGDLYRDMKDYRQAFMDYTYSIHYNKKFCTAWIQRAELLSRLDYDDKAIQDYNMALPLAETRDIKILIYVNRAELKRRKHDLDGALDDVEKAYQIDSSNLGILANLGGTLSELGRKQEAIRYLEKAIAIDPSFEGGIGNLAFLYSNMGNYKKAIELGDKLLKIKPNDPFALNNRGYAKMLNGDLEGALEDINNSILIMPYNSYAFRNRALVYIRKNKKSEVCVDLDKAISLGFTKQYGDEVEQLIKKYCQAPAPQNKL